jgi:membrane protease YdiL (CAAX protease family)
MAQVVLSKTRFTRGSLKPIGWAESIATFGFFSILLWLAIYVGIDWLRRTFGLSIMISWFISGTLIALLPMIVYTLLMVRREGAISLDDFAEHLRMKRLRAVDAKWVISGLIGIAVASGVLLGIARVLDPKFLPTPPFMEVPSGNLFWIFLGWIPLFICNIFGEELLWRGYVLHRQELVFGKSAWLVNGLLWLLFHWSINLPTMVMIVPTTLIVPWIVQRKQNTWIGILIHGIFNGLGFIFTVTGLAMRL